MIMVPFVADLPLNRTADEIEDMLAADAALREFVLKAVRDCNHSCDAVFEALLSVYLDLSINIRGGEVTVGTLRRAAAAIPRIIEARKQATAKPAGRA
jgi:hypothetical protein